jgi:hypothetical protein
MAGPMSARHVVGMHMPHRSERADQGHAALAAALPGAEVGEPDSDGMFDIALEAADREAALERVWNAVAASGADDHIVFAEHPDVPEHWRPG